MKDTIVEILTAANPLVWVQRPTRVMVRYCTPYDQTGILNAKRDWGNPANLQTSHVDAKVNGIEIISP
jgi:hypothetical protein